MKMQEQYACLLVREFPAHAIVRLRPELREQAFVILEGEPPLQTVLSLNTRARLMGLRRGMTKVEVDTFEGVSCVPRSAASEHSARLALMECASTFSPRVEVRNEGISYVCCIDITGTEGLFGSPAQLAKSLRSRCALLGLSAQVVVSANLHTAILVAKALPAKVGTSVIAVGEETQALAPLPLSVLELPEPQAQTFSLWGIRTLGMLAALPSSQLISRIGQEGRRLQQLATGTWPHLFQPVDTPFVLEESVEIEHPLDNLESLLFGIAVMLDHLIARASLRVYALASVAVELSLEGGGLHRRKVSPRVPTNDKHLWLKLLRLDLEAHPAPAPIVGVRIHAEPGSTSKVQLGLFSPQLPEAGRLDVTLARIAAIVGEENVGAAVLDDTHSDNGFHMEAFTVSSTHTDAPETPHSPRGCLRRFDPPAQAVMEIHRGRPARLRFHGRQYRVSHSYGPWLLGSEWWSERLWGQEQWDLIARDEQGGVLFCCVLRDFVQQRWVVAGLYD
jgi:protein ImuB